ncbi:Beta-phenylalanine transaminase [Escovopsis weberi]|uniref:Beta-phenylalanine transaminase n=1 Tax=Escovopsis weberi TaxID=150374 RepID=A0A0M8MZS5_ESCWE|nr:Beta-phenylalanine transaminase [Escovopsis weberi]
MLTSVDGHAYTDFLNDYSAGLLGHSDPAIQQVLRDTISKGLSFGGQNRHEKDLAAKIVQRFGEAGIELVRFTNSGTEANTMAIASATLVTGRSKILVFTGGNHGGTMAFPRTNGQANVQPAKIMTANLPHEWVLAPFNNVEESEKIINGLPPKSLAAILVETLQGAGGCRPATREFLAFLRRVADSRGSILIVDEVMTSRLGYAGHIASMGLTADIVTMGKYMGGGMSFGVFGGRRDIMQIFDPLSGGVKHAGTFNNNVLT